VLFCSMLSTQTFTAQNLYAVALINLTFAAPTIFNGLILLSFFGPKFHSCWQILFTSADINSIPKELMPLLQKEMVSVIARGSRYTRISPRMHQSL
jgi:hypothetical protein